MTKRQCVNPFLFIRTHKVRGKGRKVEGVGVVKDIRVKLDEMNVNLNVLSDIHYKEWRTSRLTLFQLKNAAISSAM